MLGHSAKVALHEAARGFFGITQGLLDRRAVVGLHPLKDRPLLITIEILDEGDCVVGLELGGDVRDLLRLHLVDQVLTDIIVEFGKHVRADDPGEGLDQAIALIAPGKLDQVGDVGGMERSDQFARGFIVACFDSVENLLDERGRSRSSSSITVSEESGRGAAAMCSLSLTTCSLDWTRWRPPMGAAALAQPPAAP